jgi:hypothetical protein
MRTDDLIGLLTKDVQPEPRGLVGRRIGLALLGGGLVTFCLVALWLGCQPLLPASRQPWFWMKASYTGLLILPAFALSRRFARPGGQARFVPAAILAIVAVMAAVAATGLLQTPREGRLPAWLGETWRVCSPLILLLSLPIYAALVVALRTLAPTRLTAAGAAAGFLAGALAATIYGLHCPEQGAAFVATWYSLGIAAATGVGALTGRWLLRW